MDNYMDENTEEQAVLFRALAAPTRLKLVKLLCRQRKPNALCVNALACRLGISQSAVSQHLRVLKALALVKGERRGYRVHYSINPETIKHFKMLVSSALTSEKEADKNNDRHEG